MGRFVGLWSLSRSSNRGLHGPVFQARCLARSSWAGLPTPTSAYAGNLSITISSSSAGR